MFGFETPQHRLTSRYLPGSPQQQALPAMPAKRPAADEPDGGGNGCAAPSDVAPIAPPESSPKGGDTKDEAEVKPSPKAKAKGKANNRVLALAKAVVAKKLATTAKGKASPMKSSAKAKPKAKPKAVMKAIAKNKAKARPKGTPKALAKKPATAKLKPKPANSKTGGSKAPLASMLQKWKEGMPEEMVPQEEGGEEEEKESDPCVEADDEKRNKYIGAKFAKLRKDGKIPASILRVYDNLESRQLKTKMLSKMFKKSSTGNWMLCQDKPEFQAFMRHRETFFAQEKEKSYPRAIMIHHYFNGNEQAFRAALEDGDISEVKGKNGKIMYSFEQVSQGKSKSSETGANLAAGKFKLSAKGYEAMRIGMGGFNWKQFSLEAGSGHSKEKAQLALPAPECELKWALVEKTLAEAKECQQKLLKEASKYMTKVQDQPDLKIKFKEAYGMITNNTNSLQNILIWKEPFVAFC